VTGSSYGDHVRDGVAIATLHGDVASAGIGANARPSFGPDPDVMPSALGYVE